MLNPLAEAIDALEVDNVYIYVGDAVRWDHRPHSVTRHGPTLRTIAASIHSPTSFASLATGCYPPNHGVYSFTQHIPDGKETFFDIDGFDTLFVNSVQDKLAETDPIFSVLNVKPQASHPFTHTKPPFLVMERGPGGHAPYGNFKGSAKEYFAQRGSRDINTLQSEYERAVKEDASLFESRLEELEDRNLREDTLVVYTSDHGELLGEGGLLGHNGPMCPELVEVPTVLAHPELDPGLEQDQILRHVDVLPTVVDAVETSTQPVDGVSLTKGFAEDFALSFYRDGQLTGRVPGFSGQLHYEAVWDEDGGHVFARTQQLERLAIFAGKLLKSSKRSFMRRHVLKGLRTYRRGNQTFGSPEMTIDQADSILKSAHENEVDGTEHGLSAEAEDQLRDLGYIS